MGRTGRILLTDSCPARGIVSHDTPTDVPNTLEAELSSTCFTVWGTSVSRKIERYIANALDGDLDKTQITDGDHDRIAEHTEATGSQIIPANRGRARALPR